MSTPHHSPATSNSLPAQVPFQKRGAISDDPARYINRELSWLEFNARVLSEAASADVPLYERLKFLAIYSTNLDEFFMVRAAGLQAQVTSRVHEIPPDGMTAEEQLLAISLRAHELCDIQTQIWREQVHPALREVGIGVLRIDELPNETIARLDQLFWKEIFPVLTPIAIDPVHPFPHLRNRALNVGIMFETGNPSEPTFGLVQLPPSLTRLVPVEVDGYRRAFITLENLIIRHVERMFPHLPSIGSFAFRVTRNFDIELDDEEGEDLLLTIQAELRRRERGHAVRLEVSGSCPSLARDMLCQEHDLDPTLDLYQVNGPLMLENFTPMVRRDERKELSDAPFSPAYVPPLRDSDDFFKTIRKGDVLLHHPYESFEAVIDFVNQAAEDPNVLAIKQTLYRTGGESPLVRALQRAAELGKQVTAVVELKARFDEASNIQWAHALERSGVNVMYGLLGFKTHAKVLLVVRRETDGLRRYVHLATGNYNQQTARLYEDISLFTAREDMGEDATSLFNLLTGYSAPDRWNQLVTAPLGLHEAVLGLIHRELNNAKQGKPARIVAKMNALVDADVIEALYLAAQAGVKIELLVRGICCLRPQVPGLSENIVVHAVIDRFLEHARIFLFENDGKHDLFCGSADWMPRNFRRRVEVMFPILDPELKARVRDEILAVMARDNAKSWVLGADGRYTRADSPPGEPRKRSQEQFVEDARACAHRRSPGIQATEFQVPGDAPSPLGKLRRPPKNRVR